jgi:hypothetical protein
VAEKEEQRAAVQNELDDLLMVLGDLEEKATTYKVAISDAVLKRPATEPLADLILETVEGHW